MYPAHYFSLFPAFPQTTKIFVAMSFSDRFKPRFENVIAKAIRHVERDGVPCEPVRVDARSVSDSILTEILEGIRSSFLVFADITTMDKVGDHAIRNGNVMYEVGIAHAVRLPEEVILFRSDGDDLLFDTRNVRVNTYDPDNQPEKAHDDICNAIVNAAQEIDLRRHMAVERATRMLDFHAWSILGNCLQRTTKHPVVKTMRDVMSNMSVLPAINKLLELGLIQMQLAKFSLEEVAADPKKTGESLFEYHLTPFGKVVLERTATDMGEMLGLRTAEDYEMFQKLIAEQEPLAKNSSGQEVP